MCQMPSWFEHGKRLWFPTDAAVAKAGLVSRAGDDVIGHRAMRKMYPEIPDDATPKETYPYPKVILAALNAGKMRKMCEAAGIRHLEVTDDGHITYWQDYRADGTVWRTTHYRNGKRNDPGDGSAAETEYRADGTVERTIHYRDGKCNDPDDGSPAVTVYSTDNGAVESTCHYRDGRPVL